LQSKIEIQAAQGGLTLADIEEKFGVGRRTAMRMRDAGKHTFPQIEEVVTSERTERWRIPTGTLGRLAAYSVEELTALQSAVRLMGRDNWQVEAAELAELSAELGALLKQDVARGGNRTWKRCWKPMVLPTERGPAR
jgi:predicted DNA-binding transcriptional regulator YafY